MPFLTIEIKLVYEIIGYIASTFILVSFLMKDIRTIRIINIFGAIFFVLYGLFTKTWATATMNFILIFVHLFHLFNFKKKNKTVEK